MGFLSLHIESTFIKSTFSSLRIPPTSWMSEPPDFLAIDIGLVPNQLVNQTWPCGVPPLVQPSLDRRADVHLGQTTQRGDGRGRGWRGEEDSKQGEVAGGSGAQVAQLHKGPWDWNLLLNRLGRARWRVDWVRNTAERERCFIKTFSFGKWASEKRAIGKLRKGEKKLQDRMYSKNPKWIQ